jgi:Effector-associated domain 1
MAFIELTGKQQLRLGRVLRTLTVNEAKFNELLLVHDTSLDDVAGAVVAFPSRALLAIKEAQAKGWLLDLIAEAREEYPADPALRAFEDELKVLAPGAHIDPFQVCRLSGGHILVNRSTLRKALGELAKPAGKRILVVQDDPALATSTGERIKTGKSHTLQMISYLQQVVGGFEIARLDLEAESRAVGSGKLIQPRDLAKSLTALMGCKHILSDPPGDGQWARWNLEFCNDFEKAVKAAPRTWIVVDSFHLVLLPADTIDLLKELATRVNTTLPNMRMVLLGYSSSFHPSVRPTVEDEILRLIGEDELAEFFARADLEMARPLNEDKVAEKVLAVLDGLDPSQPDFIVKVSSLVIAELDKP